MVLDAVAPRNPKRLGCHPHGAADLEGKLADAACSSATVMGSGKATWASAMSASVGASASLAELHAAMRGAVHLGGQNSGHVICVQVATKTAVASGGSSEARSEGGVLLSKAEGRRRRAAAASQELEGSRGAKRCDGLPRP